MNIPENVLVDDEDREKLEAMGKWYIGNHGYCIRDKKNKNIRNLYLMHRIIINCPDGMDVDHINHNRLDNRKSNLRIVTRQQNHFNRSKVKGYIWNKSSKKWQAYIVINRKKIHLGYFDTEEEARNAYLLAKEKYHKI